MLAFALLSGCTPPLRLATQAEAAATGVQVPTQHATGQSGGELTVRNAGPRPCFLTRPYHCSVYLFLYDAQHRPLLPNRKVKRYCNPAEAGPVGLAPGDSIRNTLESPRDNHDEDELRNARFFEVVYQASITTQLHAPRSQRFTRYTFKVTGTVE
ncbi:hypothetical protein I2I05_20300 [Hymenobacter sp. BT683]|uniref:Uncharacterized protein n=1 Tax=Hymenobacter jeongseonensis TaxID=2791027 RepID=A0ABS0IMZ9_9BACT|nr:hypothetical protein [Hymenobacter jeongseonensis]MBF9239746.1 hypothetical protein [Hymenobacter jeongseonensis]